jgi:putative spermidine/putrescine transport system substrate-binding protein
MHMLLMLAGGDPARMSQGIARFGKLKNCIPTLEPSASKFEEKIQLGEYLIGVHASIRAIPLIKQGYPIKYIIPKEGSILGYSIVAPVKNARNARLAQELCNWLIGPEAQKVLMETAFYVPVNDKVEVSPELQQLGLPNKQTMEKIIPVQASIIAERRREWVRQVEREMSH